VLDTAELERFLEAAREVAPELLPLILFLADTGVRLGEASALRWQDVDLGKRPARICRSLSDGQYLVETKTGRERVVELSRRLATELEAIRPDLFGEESLVFPSESGGFIAPHNFRSRGFRRVVRGALGESDDSRRTGCVTPSQRSTWLAGPTSRGFRRWGAGRARSCCWISTATSCRPRARALRMPSPNRAARPYSGPHPNGPMRPLPPASAPSPRNRNHERSATTGGSLAPRGGIAPE
jgi:integrase